MILVDTSVWIDHLRGTETQLSGLLTGMRGKPGYFRPGKDSVFAAGELGA